MGPDEILLQIESNPRWQFTMPDGWKTKFSALLLYTQLNPSQAAHKLGINMLSINRHIKRTKDSNLENLINESRHADHQRRIEAPSVLDIKSPKLVEMGVKHLTDWQDDEENALPLTERVLAGIKDARIQLTLDLSRKDESEQKAIQGKILEVNKADKTLEEPTALDRSDAFPDSDKLEEGPGNPSSSSIPEEVDELAHTPVDLEKLVKIAVTLDRSKRDMKTKEEKKPKVEGVEDAPGIY